MNSLRNFKFSFLLFFPQILYSQTDSLELLIYDCIVDSFEEINIDIISELQKYEEFLIANGDLESSSAKSYRMIYLKQSKDPTFAFLRDYNVKTALDSLYSPRFSNCFKNSVTTEAFKKSESFYKKIHIALKEGDSRKYDNLFEYTIKTTMDALSPEDYGNSLFRIYALYSFYVGSLNSG